MCCNKKKRTRKPRIEVANSSFYRTRNKQESKRITVKARYNTGGKANLMGRVVDAKSLDGVLIFLPGVSFSDL